MSGLPGRERSLVLPLILLIFAVQAHPWQARDQTAPAGVTYTVDSQLVQVYLTVTEGSRLVTGLTSADFTLLEDGFTRDISRVDAATVPLQVSLLLDTSESMRDALQDTQEAAAYFVQSLQPADRITLIPFNSRIEMISQIADDSTPITEAIRNTVATGGTELYEALLAGMKVLADKEGRRALVVFSDGEDTALGRSLDVVLNAAARYGFPIYCIGAGDALISMELRRILQQLSEANSARLFLVEKPENLRTAFGEISAELRSAYVVNYYTPVPLDGRWHGLKIEAKNPAYKVRHRSGFYARTSGSRDPASERRAQERRLREVFAAPSLPMPPVEDKPARQALEEIMNPPIPEPRVDPAPLRSALPPPQRPVQEAPVFRVESRFVEVPVLLESADGREVPPLNEKDFRIYEDDALMEIVFFSREMPAQGLMEVRNRAVKEIEAAGRSSHPTAVWTNNQVLARNYLVLDDITSETGEFLGSKEAAKRILRELDHPLRRFSLHFTSESRAGILPQEGIERMLQRIDAAMPRGSSELTSDRSYMTVYEAYLIERGDRTARQLAELRYASELRLQYQNELGSVSGMETASLEMIESAINSRMIQLIGENTAYVSRSLTGLEAVVSAAAADPGDHPKSVLFISSGFALGRESGRSGLSAQTDHIVSLAKRHGIRIFSVDAGGLKPILAVPIESRAGPMLVTNPQLESIFMDHAVGWQRERESALNQLAADTGGRLLNLNNDLASLAGNAVRATGRLFYLGYMSRQPPDGRFHRIRVTASLASLQVHARSGFFAREQHEAETTATTSPDGEEWSAVLARVQDAAKSGRMRELAAGLELLARRFPNQIELWYNLGVAHLRLENPLRAVEVLQQAFMLAPRNKEVGLLLARALMAARYRRAASETLQLMTQEYPRDAGLLLELGRVYEADSRMEEAFLSYRSALDLTPRPAPEHYLLLLRTAVPLGRRAEAVLFLRSYLDAGGAEDQIRQWRQALAP